MAPPVAVVDHVLDAVADVRPEQRGRARVGVRRIIGAFEIDVPIHHGPALVSAELDRLAVLKHIAETAKPWRTSSSANVVEDFDVQRSNDIE